MVTSKGTKLPSPINEKSKRNINNWILANVK